MKTKIIVLFLFAYLVKGNAKDVKPLNTVNDTFKVFGNCDMCKNRIEGSLDKLKGVSAASWNVDTKIIKVVYDPGLTSPELIHKKIAAAGHDTEKEKAPDKVYNKLPACCKYRTGSSGGKVSASDQTHLQGSIRKVQFKISGMTCAEGCAKGIQDKLYSKKGVKSSEVNYNTQIATIIYDEKKISKEDIVTTIVSFNAKGETVMYLVEEIK
jgi:periplasmic mercuric ion binding protein